MTGFIFSCDYDCLPHRGMQADYGFDLAELDAEAAYLDLMVDAAQILDAAIALILSKIAALVHSRAGGAAERVRPEAIRG